jgi:transcriptional regulator with XRE-family HTH domain|nr:MAG TPA: Helix-turn-helix XRE-family like protein [Caudoviricetes sp.]
MRKNLKKARREAGLTQQAMADKLNIGLRYYKALESGERLGSIELWDDLEDITGIHQRRLREIQDIRHVPEDNQ